MARRIVTVGDDLVLHPSVTVPFDQVTDPGGAAGLDVGTTAGTVAAGDDSRITGALAAANLDTAATALDANAASALRVQQDARLSSTFAPRVGLYLPDVSGNYVSAPDAAALDITGDLEIVWRGALTSWLSGAIQVLVGKWASAGSQRSYYLSISATGIPTLTWTTDGTTTFARPGTTATGLGAGVERWVKATLDADNGASGHTVKFYLSTDGLNWTQLGSDVVNAGATSIYAGTAVVEVGGNAAAASLRAPGVHMGAQIRSGIDGTLVADWDGTWPHTRQRDSLGNVWTVNGTSNAWQLV